MKNKYTRILSSLEREFNNIEKGNEDVFIKTNKKIKSVNRVLVVLKNTVSKCDFKTQNDEIDFFKNTKPKIVAKLYYNLELLNIELKQVKGAAESQKQYLDNEIQKLQKFFLERIELYKYFKTGETKSDTMYFLRKTKEKYVAGNLSSNLKFNNFSTSHDDTIAQFIANTMLINYLQMKIETLEKKVNKEAIISNNQQVSKFFWTGNKVDLVELIYALQSSRAINNGKVDIKELASFCEDILNVELEGYYHTYLGLRSRKKNKTKFLDTLKKSLLRRMEKLDM